MHSNIGKSVISVEIILKVYFIKRTERQDIQNRCSIVASYFLQEELSHNSDVKLKSMT